VDNLLPRIRAVYVWYHKRSFHFPQLVQQQRCDDDNRQGHRWPRLGWFLRSVLDESQQLWLVLRSFLVPVSLIVPFLHPHPCQMSHTVLGTHACSLQCETNFCLNNNIPDSCLFAHSADSIPQMSTTSNERRCTTAALATTYVPQQ
jgi:hypothetical protein